MRVDADQSNSCNSAPSIELAVDHGGTGGPPLAEFVLPCGIGRATLDAVGIESAWAFGNRRRLVAHVEAQAIANWRLWLATCADDDDGTGTAFAAWIAA